MDEIDVEWFASPSPDGGWSAQAKVPGKGTAFAQGDTLDELRSSIASATRLALKDLPIVEHRTVTWQVYFVYGEDRP